MILNITPTVGARIVHIVIAFGDVKTLTVEALLVSMIVAVEMLVPKAVMDEILVSGW